MDAGDGLMSGLGGGREVLVQAGDECGYFWFCAASGAWPFIFPVPPVLRRGARVAGQEVNVQVWYLVADHGGVDVLGAGRFSKARLAWAHHQPTARASASVRSAGPSRKLTTTPIL